MDLAATSKGFQWVKELETGEQFRAAVTDVRRERNKLYAHLGLSLNEAVLGHHDFSVSDDEERARFAKRAWGRMGDVSKVAYALPDLLTELDVFCLELDRQFERRFLVGLSEGQRQSIAQKIVLNPYLLEGAGTIFFAPPKTGKSWLLMLMLGALQHNKSDLWPIRKATPLLVNLERGTASVLNRLACINAAYGLPDTTSAYILNARGQSLTSVAAGIREAIAEHGVDVVLLDSISRSGGYGSLKEDDTANRVMDILNSFGVTWAALGHTSRDSNDHLYGSQMFDAAADILVKVSSEQRGNTLGICLDVTHANDIKKPRPQYISLEFDDDSNLQGVRIAKETDYPSLMLSKNLSLEEAIDDLIKRGPANLGTIAAHVKRDPANVSRFLNSQPEKYRRDPKGNQVFFSLLY